MFVREMKSARKICHHISLCLQTPKFSQICFSRYVPPPPSRPKLNNPDDERQKQLQQEQQQQQNQHQQQQQPHQHSLPSLSTSTTATPTTTTLAPTYGTIVHHPNEIQNVDKSVSSLAVQYIPNYGNQYVAVVPTYQKSDYLNNNDVYDNPGNYDKYDKFDKFNGKYMTKLKKFKAYEQQKIKYVPYYNTVSFKLHFVYVMSIVHDWVSWLFSFPHLNVS